MTISIFLAFVLASLTILIIPGPTVILIISKSVSHGRRSVLPLALGVVLGDLIAMSASLLGMGAIMATSSMVFNVFKWLGALYLIYLGLKMFMRVDTSKAKDKFLLKEISSNNSLFFQAFVVTVLNPKAIAFFMTFFPQFISSNAELIPQLLILGGTYLILAAINATAYAFFASSLKNILNQSNVQRWFFRMGGTALISAGLFTAMLKRT